MSLGVLTSLLFANDSISSCPDPALAGNIVNPSGDAQAASCLFSQGTHGLSAASQAENRYLHVVSHLDSPRQETPYLFRFTCALSHRLGHLY